MESKCARESEFGARQNERRAFENSPLLRNTVRDDNNDYE
jgi:hypothetical protein